MEKQSPQDYFETVYHETFKKLSQYVMFKSPGIADAEDVVATVFTDFFQYIVLRDKRPVHVYSYLVKMANHELSRFYDQNKRMLSFDNDELNLSETVPASCELDEGLFFKIDADDLWDAVKRLAQVEQQIIVAKYRFDMPFTEIARTLGKSESAVKLRYYRSLKKIYNNVTFQEKSSSYMADAHHDSERMYDNEQTKRKYSEKCIQRNRDAGQNPVAKPEIIY